MLYIWIETILLIRRKLDEGYSKTNSQFYDNDSNKSIPYYNVDSKRISVIDPHWIRVYDWL